MGIKTTINEHGVVSEKVSGASTLVVAIPSTGITGGFVGATGPTVTPVVVSSQGAYYPSVAATINSIQVRMETDADRFTSDSFMEIWILE